jgi:hypothetical protein
MKIANPIDLQLLVKQLLIRQLLTRQLLMTWHFRISSLQEHSSSGALCLQEHSGLQERFAFRSTLVFRSALPSGASKLQISCWFLCSLLAHSEPLYNLNFCLWSCTLEQILAIPIINFLIPCFHQNSKGSLLNTFCSNKPGGMSCWYGVWQPWHKCMLMEKIGMCQV